MARRKQPSGLQGFLSVIGGIVAGGALILGVILPAISVFVDGAVKPLYSLGGPYDNDTPKTISIPVGWECAQIQEMMILCRPIGSGAQMEEQSAPAVTSIGVSAL